VRGELRGQQLERHPAVQPDVAGLVDDAHAAAADHRLDLVVGEGGPRLEEGLLGTDHQPTGQPHPPQKRAPARTGDPHCQQ
jgi:hypothetical protein